MRLTRYTDYAMRVLLYLGAQPADRLSPIAEIARSYDISQNHLMKVVNDLKSRGVEDILIAVVDGLKGFPEAIGAVFPATTVQTCIVHLIRNSLDYATWKDRRAVAAELKII